MNNVDKFVKSGNAKQLRRSKAEPSSPDSIRSHSSCLTIYHAAGFGFDSRRDDDRKRCRMIRVEI